MATLLGPIHTVKWHLKALGLLFPEQTAAFRVYAERVIDTRREKHKSAVKQINVKRRLALEGLTDRQQACMARVAEGTLHAKYQVDIGICFAMPKSMSRHIYVLPFPFPNLKITRDQAKQAGIPSALEDEEDALGEGAGVGSEAAGGRGSGPPMTMPGHTTSSGATESEPAAPMGTEHDDSEGSSEEDSESHSEGEDGGMQYGWRNNGAMER